MKRLEPPVFWRFPPNLARFLALGLLSCLVASCGVTDFMGAYFNTYYNAQRQFAEAEQELWQTPDLKQTGKNYLLPINAQGGTKQKLTSVIEKCSKLLQYHPESPLVDDALMMIGKSYYYQADFTRSERKFRELIETYPKSNLLPEARVMLAYALWKERSVDSAAVLARAVGEEAEKEGDDDVASLAFLLLGQTQQDAKAFALARESYDRAGALGGEADFRASAFLTSADLSLTLGDSSRALSAYRRAENEGGSYVSEFKSRLGQARALIRLKSTTEAMTLLEQLRRNTNYKEFWGEVDVEIGNCHTAALEYDAAVQQYHYVDTAYARSESAAKADYRLGQLYETKLGLLDSARVAYSKGRAVAGASTIAPLLTERADLLTRYATLRATIRLNDSLRTLYLAAPDSAARANIGRTAAPDSSARRRDTTATTEESPARRVGEETPAPAPAPATGRAARRMTTATPLPKVEAVTVSAPVGPGGGVTLDSLDARLASSMAELGTLFFTTLQQPDSARYWLDTLLQRYPSSPHAARVLFVRAEMLHQRDSVAARPAVDSLYRQIIARYPSSEFAGEARRQLGLPPVRAAVDEGEMAYRRTEQLIASGDFPRAVDSLHAIARRFPSSQAASRAMFAVGWLYEEKLLNPDSARAHYERVAAAYPKSQYAALATQRLTAAAEAEKADKAAKEAAEKSEKAAKEAAEKAVKSPSARPDSTQPAEDDMPASGRRRGRQPVMPRPAVKDTIPGVRPQLSVPDTLLAPPEKRVTPAEKPASAFPAPPSTPPSSSPPTKEGKE